MLKAFQKRKLLFIYKNLGSTVGKKNARVKKKLGPLGTLILTSFSKYLPYLEDFKRSEHNAAQDCAMCISVLKLGFQRPELMKTCRSGESELF